MPIDMTWTQRRSRFVYGTGASEVSWTTLLPVRPWDRNTRTLGGSLVAGSGVPASYIIRRDHVLLIRLRFLESEWDDLLDMLAWGQASESFRWYPDALEDGEYYSVWLDFPAAGEDIAPDRSSEFPKAMEITVGIRTVSGNSWRKEFFDYTALPPDVPTLGIPTYLLSDGSRGEPATEVAGTYMDIGIKHGALVGGEYVEVWMQEVLSGMSEYSQSVVDDAPSAYLRMDTADTSMPDVSGNGRDGFSNAPSSTDEGLFPGSAVSRLFDGDVNKRVVIARDTGDDWMDHAGVGNYIECWIEGKALVDQAQTVVGIADILWLRTLSDGTVQLVQRWDGAGSGYTVGTLADPRGGTLVIAPGERWFIGIWANSDDKTPSRWWCVGGGVPAAGSGPGGTDARVYIGQDFIVGGGPEFSDVAPLEEMLVDEVAIWAGVDSAAAEVLFNAHWADREGVEVTGGDEWFRAVSAPAAGSTQVIRTEVALTPGVNYLIATRYRLGPDFSPGAVFDENNQPAATWASLSRGEETTSSNPATLDSAVWSRTASDAERITLSITPANADQDIKVWRKLASVSTWTQIDTIAGPHGATVEYADETIAGETLYDYAVSTGTGARGASVRVWSGPVGIPEYLYDQALGSGYRVGFDPSDVAYETELWDNYDDGIGGISSFALRATAAAGATEVDSAPFSNVPDPEFTFNARLRHKLTSFTVDDFGQYGPDFSVTIPGSE